MDSSHAICSAGAASTWAPSTASGRSRWSAAARRGGGHERGAARRAFDFVSVGSLLIHLRDPVRALERLRAVCRGELVLLDDVDLPLTLAHPRRPVAALDGRRRPWWWKLNLAGLARVIEAGGFRAVARPMCVLMPPRPGQERPPLSARALVDPGVRGPAFKTRVGDPHAALRALPAR